VLFYFQKAEQNLDGRGFARTVGAQKTVDASLRYMQTDFIQHLELAKTKAQVFGLYDIIFVFGHFISQDYNTIFFKPFAFDF